MGETHGKNKYKISPPHPVFGNAENGMGWGLHVILNPWVKTHGYYSYALSGHFGSQLMF